MAISCFYIPSVNVIGQHALDEALNFLQERGFRRALIVTDQGLVRMGVAQTLSDALARRDINAVIYDETHPNPTTTNVEAGLALLRRHDSECVISLGGGSPHDCAKAIALVAANGGDIRDYEGVDRSAAPQLPMVAINTTAGTASEMTRFCIITDEVRHIKMAIVDKHVTPLLSVNDPLLMRAMPASLTAATGMIATMAAVESGWGTSKLARVNTNLFGMKCSSSSCNSGPGKVKGYLHFASVKESVSAYVYNLNTHPAYKSFRSSRAQLRKTDTTLTAKNMIHKLKGYSTRGVSYNNFLLAMYQSNQHLMVATN